MHQACNNNRSKFFFQHAKGRAHTLPVAKVTRGMQCIKGASMSELHGALVFHSTTLCQHQILRTLVSFPLGENCLY